MSEPDQRGAIGFAEKVLELLDGGRYAATYKYAVLLALMDVLLEGTQRSGAPPTSITTRQLAEKVVELYWPHSVPFGGLAPAGVLRQNVGGQAEIISRIVRFREEHAVDPSVPRWEARLHAPPAYERLVRFVEWKLIEMPLPRLQTADRSSRPFIYQIYWDETVPARAVREYQNGAGGFDNRLLLLPQVGEYFLQLSGLLRPLIERRWAAMVAALNTLEESYLETFLFGAARTPTTRVRVGLWEMQEGRCFYCDGRVADPSSGEVDHFIPWSRYPDDRLDNFVVADGRCNGEKSNRLAATTHLVRWARRFAPGAPEHAALSALADRSRWDRDASRTLNVARAIYCRLPADARLWVRRGEFEPPDPVRIGPAVAGPEMGAG